MTYDNKNVAAFLRKLLELDYKQPGDTILV